MRFATGRFLRFAIFVLCLGALPSGCGDDDPVSPNAEKCDVSACNGGTILSFGEVAVGDTVGASFSIGNTDYYNPYHCVGGADLRVEILKSNCPDYSWSYGERTIACDATMAVGVRFHPTTLGGHSCQVSITPSMCQNVIVRGKGIEPPTGALVGVCGRIDADVRVTVTYDQGGAQQTVVRSLEERGILETVCEYIRVPEGATDMQVHAERDTSSAPGPWDTIFHESFPQPVTKCYSIVGILDFWSWSEMSWCSDYTSCP